LEIFLSIYHFLLDLWFVASMILPWVYLNLLKSDDDLFEITKSEKPDIRDKTIIIGINLIKELLKYT